VDDDYKKLTLDLVIDIDNCEQERSRQI